MKTLETSLCIRRIVLAALLPGLFSTPAPADVIFEEKGLYTQDTWNIKKYYDDLENPNDKPGVLTSGEDPHDPSGPAVDFDQGPGLLPNVEERAPE